MAKRAAKRVKREKAAPAPEDPRVPVVIRAGRTHRDGRYEVDTPYQATPREAERLAQFNALVGES
jgi:hypothetical protein